MKRIALFVICLALVSASANAQNLLQRLGNRAKNALEQNVGRKVEQGVNDILDGKAGKKDAGKPASAEAAGSKAETETAAVTETAATPQEKARTAYAKSDFVPGDEIIFDDPMDDEQLGEFPSRWELLGGEAEVMEIDGKKCLALTHHLDRVSPLMKNPRNYLGDVFTVEFDVFYTGEEEGSLIWVFLPADSDKEPVFTLEAPVVDNRDSYGLQWWWEAASGNQDGQKPGVVVSSGKWHHFALSFNKRALKFYLDGERMINIPNVSVVPGWFTLESVFEPMMGISNIRIAKGAVPLYDRLAGEGKIITYAITFDTGKATLKPEADVEINRIRELMEKDATLRFEVQGHCDSTGSDAVNDRLSQQRAEAIVARLAEMGVARDRLTAVGKGSREPIADNGTEEGRAKNRRVEFVKK